MGLDQSTRDLQLSTPLGENELLLIAFSGFEHVSQLFSFQLDMISDNNAIAAKDIVGKPVTFSVKMLNDSRRFFHGFVSRFFAGDEDENQRRNYRAEVVPWLWFLSRTSDCRIFQNMTVPDIVEKIFGDLGFSDFKMQVSGNHPTREYVVQYRETDLQFVSRLMEEEGIFYYFTHADGKHEMVIGDGANSYYDCEQKEVEYPLSFATRPMAPHITSWEHRFEFRTGKVMLTDYNFTTPSTSLRVKSDTTMQIPGVSKYEFYDYPGIYGDTGTGRPIADIRMEEEEAGYDVVEASSVCQTFSPGGKFTIKKHRSASEEGKGFVLLAVTHHASESQGYETGSEVGEGGYDNMFTCIPDSVVYRAPRITPKPFVQGVQTAVVVGPSGEEIYTDEYGRVKIQFPWDREGKKDENSSCWVRVSQNWAGQNWGIIFNPRIGQEVIVDFIEGDPDRPIITGRVYNAEQMPPYALPGEQTKSTIKTRSSKGGGADNFNEIRFEDKMGSEEIYIHAEKDQNNVVEHNQTIFVGNDRSETIGRDRSLKVGRDKSEKVDRNKKVHVDGYHDEKIYGDMTVMVAKNLTETVAFNYAETVGAAMELGVGGFLAIAVGAAMTESVGGCKSQTVGITSDISVGQNLVTTVGNDMIETVGRDQLSEVAKCLKVRVGESIETTAKKDSNLKAKKISMVADEELSIKVGSATLVMKKNGDITINGKKISVKGSSDVVLKGSKILGN